MAQGASACTVRMRIDITHCDGWVCNTADDSFEFDLTLR
jgi:hypothetical protein